MSRIRPQNNTDFDFSSLFELLQSMKRQFWNYDRGQERFKHQLSRLHNSYFSKLNNQTAVMNSINDKKNKSIKKVTPSGDLSKDEQEEELNEALGFGEEIEPEQVKQFLTNPILIQILEEMRKEEKNGVIHDDAAHSPTKKRKKASAKKGAKPIIGQRSQRNLAQKLGSKTEGSIEKDRAKDLGKAQVEKVPVDWFREFLIQTAEDEETQKAVQSQVGRFKEVEEKVDKMFSDEINQITYYDYEQLMRQDDVREKIALRLQMEHESLKSTSIHELQGYIKKADKDLFLKLKNGVYTLDQLKARIAERKTGLRYVVLDDLKEQLNPKFFETNFKRHESAGQFDKIPGLADLQTKKPQKITKKSHIFSSVSRERGPKHKNYQAIPESIGLVDFNQPEVCKRQPKRAHNKPLSNVFSVKRPPEKLIDERTVLSDPQLVGILNKQQKEREKKQANIARLKKQLGIQLWNHRQLEMKEMPYDSSKVQFHDKMDMFFREKDMMKPEIEGHHPGRKKVGTSADEGKKQDKFNEYINAYEQRKKELNERRFNMLFLKRLENDGVKITISKADRELLRNFGKFEEEEAENELNKAMKEDQLSVVHTEEEKLLLEMDDRLDPEERMLQLEKYQEKKAKAALNRAVPKRKAKTASEGFRRQRKSQSKSAKMVEVSSQIQKENFLLRVQKALGQVAPHEVSLHPNHHDILDDAIPKQVELADLVPSDNDNIHYEKDSISKKTDVKDRQFQTISRISSKGGLFSMHPLGGQKSSKGADTLINTQKTLVGVGGALDSTGRLGPAGNGGEGDFTGRERGSEYLKASQLIQGIDKPGAGQFLTVDPSEFQDILKMGQTEKPKATPGGPNHGRNHELDQRQYQQLLSSKNKPEERSQHTLASTDNFHTASHNRKNQGHASLQSQGDLVSKNLGHSHFARPKQLSMHLSLSKQQVANFAGREGPVFRTKGEDISTADIHAVVSIPPVTMNIDEKKVPLAVLSNEESPSSQFTSFKKMSAVGQLDTQGPINTFKTNEARDSLPDALSLGSKQAQLTSVEAGGLKSPHLMSTIGQKQAMLKHLPEDKESQETGISASQRYLGDGDKFPTKGTENHFSTSSPGAFRIHDYASQAPPKSSSQADLEESSPDQQARPFGENIKNFASQHGIPMVARAQAVLRSRQDMKGVFSMNSLSTNQFYLDENKRVISPTSSNGVTNFGPRIYSAVNKHSKDQGTGYDSRVGANYKSMDMSSKKAEPQSSLSQQAPHGKRRGKHPTLKEAAYRRHQSSGAFQQAKSTKSNPTQQRLINALAQHRLRKQQFKEQLQLKEQGLVNTSSDPSVIPMKNFGSSNFGILLNQQQQDTIEYERIKNECKVNNDYKSLAAVARLQRKTVMESRPDNLRYWKNQDSGYVQMVKPPEFIEGIDYALLQPPNLGGSVFSGELPKSVGMSSLSSLVKTASKGRMMIQRDYPGMLTTSGGQVDLQNLHEAQMFNDQVVNMQQNNSMLSQHGKGAQDNSQRAITAPDQRNLKSESSYKTQGDDGRFQPMSSTFQPRQESSSLNRRQTEARNSRYEKMSNHLKPRESTRQDMKPMAKTSDPNSPYDQNVRNSGSDTTGYFRHMSTLNAVPHQLQQVDPGFVQSEGDPAGPKQLYLIEEGIQQLDDK